MRFAIFSDIHGNRTGWQRVLADAEAQNIDQLVCLGDVGREAGLFVDLQEMNTWCVCGNWEVSGLHRLPAALSSWVGEWPVTIEHNSALFCHATPDMPPAARSTAALADLMRNGASWMSLFPRLHRNEDAVWRALATLEERDLRVAFHGHTHVQQVWAWRADGRGGRRLAVLGEQEQIVLETGAPATPARYLIGVGSAGEPQDGPDLRYAIYDEDAQTVSLRRLPP